ncbi:MAG: 3-isopropylmalate dehydratase small subunit [Desulfosudaceae bacterium]
MKTFGGRVLFLDRDDINTDEIIPARYLTEVSKQALAPHLMEDLALEGFDPALDIAGRRAIVTRANFGCGSSREHAAWALEVNDINLVVAESFSRIFRQNLFNCGMLAVRLEPETVTELFEKFAGRDTTVEVDRDRSVLLFAAGDSSREAAFSLSSFDRDLIDAGGWVEYADARY